MGKKTVVLGASMNPARYSNMAIKRLTSHQHPVVAIGRRKGAIGDVEIKTDHAAEEDVDTVTLYIGAKNQDSWKEYVYKLNPRRLIFNPGTENADFKKEAEAKGIECVEACTLVLLSIGSY